MGKIRIYELAKELGVDNRIVLDKAQEFGFAGKTSHSNSLESDEADQIRRSVIRDTMSKPGAAETVKTQINRDTGTSEKVVERRRGDIIRRRRTDEADAVDAAPEVEETPAIEVAAELEPEPVVESIAAPLPSAPPVAEAVVENKIVPGPKILGKMELQKERKPRAPSITIETPVVAAGEEEEEGSGAEGRRQERRSRSKRMEFTRVDLVDYDGSGPRRTPKRKKRRGQDDGDEIGDNGKQELTTPKASKRVVKMAEGVTVGELARQMSLKSSDVIQRLIQLGVMATINQTIDQDTATILAEEFGFSVESTSFDETAALIEAPEEPGAMVPRAPVVTVMGHVDHGKTSLLDKIRASSVAAKEHGGITQHIGAYSVETGSGKRVTFLDTPGHAAFTSMRARGAKVTDIVVLVVAADDGVMPQTIEAIHHAKAASVPIVVAVNKMDKPGANPERVKQQLVEHGLQPEDWGGDTIFVPVSALSGDGIPQLLESLLLLAEMNELKANPDRLARGTVIEARMERGRGIVATILISSGTLKIGDIFISGGEYGRVKSMVNHAGVPMMTAAPADPAEITGFFGMPSAGDDFIVAKDEALAREVAENRKSARLLIERAQASGPMSLEDFAKRTSEFVASELNLILKADVDGSLEAIATSLEKLSTPKVKVRVVHAGVGAVNESDVQLAIASKAFIIGFNIRAESRALEEAEGQGIDVRFYRVIYELIDEVKLAMEGLLEPIKKEVRLGSIEVRETYSVPKVGTVAGCYVLDGAVKRGAKLRLLRDSAVVYEGKLSTLRRFKDDVKEVQSGYECGLSIENFNDIKSGDTIEVFEVQEIRATLDSVQ